MGELFCGPGGLALGAQLFSKEQGHPAFEHAWANDLDRDTCNTFIQNIDGASPNTVICETVRTLDFQPLGPIDCLAFGFPCNDFSVVGERLGVDGKFGPLYTYGVAALNHFNPACFVAENVSGLTSANEGKTFCTIISDMQRAGDGYNVSAHLYKAEEYGVPQRRRRILIVGIRKDIAAEFRVPYPETGEKPLTVRDALLARPIPVGAKNNELTRQSHAVVERLKHIKAGQNAFNSGLPKEHLLNVKGARISQIYRRLELDSPSYTVTGSGGGGTHIYHWEENRALTNRERARLQGFPDDFVFEGSKESVRKQIGMAVPPPLSRAVLGALWKTLNGVAYRGVDSNIVLDTLQPSFVMEKRLAYN
jgi:DNA (cytosine-5)-methyltransferase 1